MTKINELKVPIHEITVPDDRARGLDPVWAEALARSIEEFQLFHPIIVKPLPDGGFRLVAGLHRLEAHKMLERIMIRVTLLSAETDEEAKLEEVMENLIRHDLKALDRCRHLFELKQAYELKNPQAKHGGDRKSSKIKIQNQDFDSDEAEVFGFAKAR